MTEWIFTSSALILIVIALRGLLLGKLRPMIRYCLWGLVLIRLLMPFSLFESAFSLGNALQNLTQQADSALEQYESAQDQVIRQHTQEGISMTPSQIREETRQQVYDDTYAAISDHYERQGITVADEQLRQEAQAQTQAIDLLALVTGLLPMAWYAGMVVMALAFLGSNGWFAWNLRKTRIPRATADLPIPVFETDYPATPCLFGLIRPKVYLTPESTQDGSLLRHVLTHELTHYRHADHIWSLLRGVCLIVHWYNPLVWAAAILSKKDAELACDEDTIRSLGEAERIAYGKTLIRMTCAQHEAKGFLVTATTMADSKNTLKNRILTIAKKPKNAIFAMIACVLVLSVAAGCTFTGAPTNAAVYEKLTTAVQSVNSRDAYHFKCYITDFAPSEADLSHSDFIEGWVSGDDMYTEQTHSGSITPRFLCYGGNSYSHTHDNIWVPTAGVSKDSISYKVSLPSRDLTMTRTEKDGFLDVTFVDDSNGAPTVIRLDAAGNLIRYTYCVIITGSPDAQGAVRYATLVYEDTDPAEIREHLDTVAPNLIAGMENDNSSVTYPFSKDAVELFEGLLSYYQETLTWTALGIAHDTTCSIPVIQPFSSDAVYIQEQINAQLLPWLEDQRSCQYLKTDSAWNYIRFEAAIYYDILSIVTDVHWTASDTHDYQVYNLDLNTGQLLTSADMASRFLGISYPEFLMAVSEYRMDRLQATQPNVDMRAVMAEYAPDVAEMDEAALYLDKDGNLCLKYIYMDIAGAMFLPTVTTFSLDMVDWEAPTEQEAYIWLFDLYKPEEWNRDSILSDYRSLLQYCCASDPERFEQYYSLIEDETAAAQIRELINSAAPAKTT